MSSPVHDRSAADTTVGGSGAGRLALMLLLGARSAIDRVRRCERGQDVLEYAGMLVLVAAVFVALFQLGLPAHIKDGIDSAINSVFGSGGGHAGATASHTAAH